MCAALLLFLTPLLALFIAASAAFFVLRLLGLRLLGLRLLGLRLLVIIFLLPVPAALRAGQTARAYQRNGADREDQPGRPKIFLLHNYLHGLAEGKVIAPFNSQLLLQQLFM